MTASKHGCTHGFHIPCSECSDDIRAKYNRNPESFPLIIHDADGKHSHGPFFPDYAPMKAPPAGSTVRIEILGEAPYFRGYVFFGDQYLTSGGCHDTREETLEHTRAICAERGWTVV